MEPVRGGKLAKLEDKYEAQLKELIVSPQDPQPLSDSVVAAIQEYQRYRAGRGRAWTPRSGASAHLAPAAARLCPLGHCSHP